VSVLDVDIETYSSVDIKKANVYAYTESPDFEVLMAAWSLDGSPVEVAIGEKAISEIPGLWDSSVKKVAHNAGFERVCFSRMRGLPVGTYLPPEDWYDTAAVAAERGLPRDLDRLARAVGADPKDSAGTRLINLFCRPNGGRRVMPEDQPEKWAEFVEYCRQDVVTLQGVRKHLAGWPSEFERNLWYLDQKINDRGVFIDLAMAHKAVEAAGNNAEDAQREVIDLTGVENPGSTQQLSAWAESVGFPMPNWQAETVTSALDKDDLEPDVRRVLELRQELALVASNKYVAALRSVSRDGRLRGQFMFHGAHTGRWSSKGVQVHNLPKKGFADDEGEPDLVAQDAAILDLMFGYGASPGTLKKLVRPLFVGPFAVSDFSAIEARVIAWLAGEQWVLDAFAEGRDIYVETANRMSTANTKFTRADGKIAVLALGFGGGVNALRRMGARGSEAELKRLIDFWRKTNPEIVRLWSEIEYLWRRADPDSGFTSGSLRLSSIHGSDVRVDARGTGKVGVFWVPGTRTVQLVLPSKRRITYRRVRWNKADRDANNDAYQKGSPADKWSRPQYFSPRGSFVHTYGGSLAENVTQAVARDLLADAMLRLDAAGYPIVAHVHDEVVVESDDIEGIVKIMKDGPTWAKGLPLNASGIITERYTK
jgi:DNA polymerase